MERITYIKPPESLFEINPSLYLAKCWAIHFKKINMDELYYDDLVSLSKIREKRKLANRVLNHSYNLIDNKKQMDIKRWYCRNKSMRLGRLTVDQEHAFSDDYFILIDKICDKLLIDLIK